MSVGPPNSCGACGSPLRPDQRYCLECGARVGARSPQLVKLLGSVRAEQGAAPPAADPQPEPAPTLAPEGARPQGLSLPAPRISALLVLVFLGFGILIGGAAGPRVSDTLASSRPPLRLLLPRAVASTVPTTTATSPPSSTPEATPTPAGSTSSAPASAAATPASAKAPAAKSVPSSAPSAGPESEPSSSPSNGTTKGAPSQGSSKLPPVKHVFLISLADQPYASVFGPASTAPYLSRMLEGRGELLVRYYAVAHGAAANGIALLSGQGPTLETTADCPRYANLEPAAVGAQEQVTGNGCVYPRSTQTLAGQLQEKHLTWRAYVQGMDEPGSASGAAGGPCGHPVLGQPDPTSAEPAPAGVSYATSRNPFVYFHSVIDSPECAARDVGLDQLSSDLAAPMRTPSFSYIVPDRCHDGSPTACSPGAPAGPAAADPFLEEVVPEITSSVAYKNGGLLIITVDQAPASGSFGDSSSCCGQPQFPNLPAPATTVAGLPSRGGGEVGALLLSPYVKPGTTEQEPYNHFSLLRTIEDLFRLKHVGYAGLAKVKSFDGAVFSAYKG